MLWSGNEVSELETTMEVEKIYQRAHAILPSGKWIDDLWSLEPGVLAVFGENLIHVKGFYPTLVKVARAYGDSALYLLDMEAERRVIMLSLADTDEQYGTRKRAAPEIGSGWGFPFGLCRQAFVGNGRWILLSDRDAERMFFIARELPQPQQLTAVWNMLRPP